MFLVSLAFGIGEAATMMGQLHLSVGEGVVYAIANGGFLPNATLFSGSFLLGPGFAVGGNTLVSPGAVVLGPLPLFAAAGGAARPSGTPGALVSSLVWLPPLVAALATMWWQRRHPALTWLEAALRGCGGGIVAGFAFAVLASVAGGAVGAGPDAVRRAVRARGARGRHHRLRPRWPARCPGHGLVAATGSAEAP